MQGICGSTGYCGDTGAQVEAEGSARATAEERGGLAGCR